MVVACRLLREVSSHVVLLDRWRLTVEATFDVVRAGLGVCDYKITIRFSLLVWRCMRKRPPMPNVGDLFDLRVLPKVILKSVGVVGFTEMNLRPLPKENLCYAVEKLIAS